MVDTRRVLPHILAEAGGLRSAREDRRAAVLQDLRHEEQVGAARKVIRHAGGSLRAVQPVRHAVIEGRENEEPAAAAGGRPHVVDLGAPLLAPARIRQPQPRIVLVLGELAGGIRRDRRDPGLLPLVPLVVDFELMAAELEGRRDLVGLVLRARAGIGQVAHGGRNVVRAPEGVPVNLVAHHERERAHLVLRAERPEVRVARRRRGVGLAGRVLRLEIEPAAVGRLVLRRVLGALVEARRVAGAEAEAAQHRASGREVAARDPEEGDVVAVFLEGRVEATQLDRAPRAVLQAHPRIKLREGSSVAVEEELGLELEDCPQAAAELLVAADAEARVARLHLVALDDVAVARRRSGESGEARRPDRGRPAALLPHELGVDLPVEHDHRIRIWFAVLAPAALLRKRDTRNRERRADCQDQCLFVLHFSRPPASSYMWNINLLNGTGPAYPRGGFSSRETGPKCHFCGGGATVSAMRKGTLRPPAAPWGAARPARPCTHLPCAILGRALKARRRTSGAPAGTRPRGPSGRPP